MSRFWYPNRRQWWVIWTSYVLAFFLNVDYMDSAGQDEARRGTTFLVVGAALLVWRFARNKAERGL